MLRSALTLAGILALVAGYALAQTTATSTTPQRDSAAVAIVQQAVTALGGFASASQISDATVSGTITPVAASSLKAGTFIWEDAPPEFRYTIQTATETRVFVSGHGQPAYEKGGVVSPLFPHMATASMPFHLPALVLARWIANTNASITLAANDVVAGTTVIHVHMSLNTDAISSQVTTQDWYFDIGTAIPLRVEYRLPDNRQPQDFVVEAEQFSNFQTVNGLQIPYQITIIRDGAVQGVGTIKSVAFNTGLSSTEFDLVQGAL